MPKKNVFKKWETWVAFFVAILTLVSLIVEVPQKIASLFKSEGEHSEIVQVLAGEIMDEDGNPLPDVEVQLPEFNVSGKTDRNGSFELKVKVPKQSQVSFRARKEGFETVNLDPCLGDSFLNFQMRAKK